VTHSANRSLWLALAVIGTTAIAAGTQQHTADTPLEKIYTDESHCLADADIRGDKDMRFGSGRQPLYLVVGLGTFGC
jgi:hypothetical protein